MKKLKTLIVSIAVSASIISLLLVISVSGCNAQGRGMSAENVAKQEIITLKAKIDNLTENEVSQLYDISLKYAEKMVSLKRSSDRSQMMEARETLQTEKNKEAKEILS